MRAAQAQGIDLLPAESFAASAGRGVTAGVAGRTVTVTSPAHLARPSGDLPEAKRQAADLASGLVSELEATGHTAVVVTLDGTPAGVLGLTERLRPDAPRAVTAVGHLTGQRPVLLTGDDHRAAEGIASLVGITDVRAGLLPQDKVAAVRDLQAGEGRLLVVGGGVDDAPALAAAHVGVAMGGTGCDVAMQTADAVITRDELVGLPAVIALSLRARRLVKQNLAIAGTAIAVLVTWDIAGHLPLPLGVAGHEGSTILVALNGLRLLRAGAWTHALQATTPGPRP